MALTKITKIGSNGLDDDVSAGGGGGLNTTQDTIDKLLFIHHGGFTADTTIGSPQKFSEIFSHADSTIDIDNGITRCCESICCLHHNFVSIHKFKG